jgi:phage major head subunit gpT-like protein
MSFFAGSSWLHDLEQNMRSITIDQYKSLLAHLWWQRVAAQKTSMAKKEVFAWLISTATIKAMEPGQADFEEMLSQYSDLENKFAGAGLTLRREQLEDIFNGVPGGEGLHKARRWSADIGKQAAYWPQKLVAHAILDGAAATSTTYDGLTFFNTAHYVNGVDSSDGTFANILNPTTVGGATRIDGAVTRDVAAENLSRVGAYIAGVKMPNGEDPRGLRMRAILHPPAMRFAVVELLKTTLIAQAAASGGGSADVAAAVRDWNLEEPIQADELAASCTSPAGNSGSDTTYYILANEVAADDDLGALVYQVREPFAIVYNDGMTDAELARTRELQWVSAGRNAVGYGHPYQLFKVTAA